MKSRPLNRMSASVISPDAFQLIVVRAITPDPDGEENPEPAGSKTITFSPSVVEVTKLPVPPSSNRISAASTPCQAEKLSRTIRSISPSAKGKLRTSTK